MIIFEIVTPGTWLDHDDKDWSWRIQGQLQSLQSQFFEANTALHLFVQAQENRPVCISLESRGRDMRRRCEVQREIEQERGVILTREASDEIYFEADIRFKREKWSEGVLPRELEQTIPLIYARSFLYALDAFDKFLGVLAKEENIPAEISRLYAQFIQFFPNLRGVRNTAQHLEDRARGLGAGRNPQTLDLKPVNNCLIHAPGGGVLVLNCLNGSRYGSTMSDGHYGEVDVSSESMEVLQQILQEVLQAFKWQGPKQHSPSA